MRLRDRSATELDISCFPETSSYKEPSLTASRYTRRGSIVSKQTFDATDVVAKKDLIVAGGIVGRVQASIKVGGCLRAKFIQNCRVASRGSIIVGAAVVNSRIYTLEKLDLGDKGRIIGGEIFAVQGVRALGIGSESGIGTKNTLRSRFHRSAGSGESERDYARVHAQRRRSCASI